MPEKSSKTCTKDGDKVSCSLIQTHFYRYFQTDSEEEDIQLTPEDYTETKVYGYYKLNGESEVKGDPIAFTPVKEGYQTALEASLEEEDSASGLTLSAAGIMLASALLL